MSLEPPPGTVREFNHAWIKWLNGLWGYANTINGSIFDLSSLTATVAELNYNDVTTLGTAEASKTVTTDTNKDITGLRYIGFGGQLGFPATAAPSADANTLDDYEEGTWTPVLSDGSNLASSSTAVGTYRKIGDVVFIKGYIVLTSLSSVSGAIRLQGLPFTSSSTSGTLSAINIEAADNMAILAGEKVGGYIGAGAAYILLQTWDEKTGTTAMQQYEWSATGQACFSGFYTV